MLVRLVEVVTWAYNVGVLVYVVSTWIRARWASRVERALKPFYEPPLRYLRSWVKPVRWGKMRMDLSPIALILVVVLVRWVVVYVLIG
ncbi:MAG TPA: YggT family protein [Isosphaeraceae bacterium]|nr:YggT family protein [Isosphaeraceae bacterium]